MIRNCGLIIAGLGLSGASAAVTAASEGIETVGVEANLNGTGGAPQGSGAIENFYGFPDGISGEDLATRGRRQMKKFGVEIIAPCYADNLEIDPEDEAYKIVTLDDGQRLRSKLVLLSLGIQYRRLESPGISELIGHGVYYYPPPVFDNYEGQDVYIVGVANSAGQACWTLLQHEGCKVNLLARGAEIGTMSQYLIDRIGHHKRVNIRYQTQVLKVHGGDKLEGLTLQTPSGIEDVKADRLYVMIGGIPKTTWLRNAVARDEKGFIYVGNNVPNNWWKLPRPPLSQETSMPGVFASGDVVHRSIQRIPVAVGTGAIAVQDMHKLLSGTAG
jgi:thioredoxin reductase (NADPH)